jgi:hypothetical protein
MSVHVVATKVAQTSGDPPGSLAHPRAALRGEILLPADHDTDRARVIWNGMTSVLLAGKSRLGGA